MTPTQTMDRTVRDFVVLWDREPPLNRGRSARLSVDEIAQAAFAVADAEGLLAASVKRVANRLRVPAVRLEGYLASRDEMFDLMLDVCLSEVVLPDPSAELGWRAQAEMLAESVHEVAGTHRWLVELIGGRSPNGPHGLRFVERALSVFRSSGLDVHASALCVNAVLSFVCGSVCIETRQRTSTRPVGEMAHGDARYLTETASPDEYPYLNALFSDAAGFTSEESFRDGLTLLLDGMAVRIDGGVPPGGGR